MKNYIIPVNWPHVVVADGRFFIKQLTVQLLFVGKYLL